MNTHQVNKIVLDFSFPPKEKDNALQKTKALFYDKALPALTDRLDQTSGSAYIEKLEVDLGETTEAEFIQKFITAFESSLGKSLTPSQSLNGPGAETGNDDTTIGLKHLLQFLEKGYWPWTIQRNKESIINAQSLAFLQADANAFLLFHLLQGEASYKTDRLISFILEQLNDKLMLMDLLIRYHPALKNFSNSLSFKPGKKIIGEQEIHFSFVHELIRTAPLQTKHELIRFLNQFKQAHIPKAGSSKRKAREAGLEAVIQSWLDENEPKNLSSVTEKGNAGITGNESSEEPGEMVDARKQLVDKHPEVMASRNKTETALTAADEKIRISNAGLILFHPYLKFIFRELKWLKNDSEFSNKATQQKAILFLQYLVNGKSRQPEHELVLNKILCGYPVKMPVKVSCNFSAAEKEAGLDMVRSLMEHWSVMKSTSVAGYIESFIRRNGLVQITDSGYLLQVERKGFDILLDSLPFSINIIKLPWNERIIHTEW